MSERHDSSRHSQRVSHNRSKSGAHLSPEAPRDHRSHGSIRHDPNQGPQGSGTHRGPSPRRSHAHDPVPTPSQLERAIKVLQDVVTAGKRSRADLHGEENSGSSHHRAEVAHTSERTRVSEREPSKWERQTTRRKLTYGGNSNRTSRASPSSTRDVTGSTGDTMRPRDRPSSSTRTPSQEYWEEEEWDTEMQREKHPSWFAEPSRPAWPDTLNTRGEGHVERSPTVAVAREPPHQVRDPARAPTVHDRLGERLSALQRVGDRPTVQSRLGPIQTGGAEQQAGAHSVTSLGNPTRSRRPPRPAVRYPTGSPFYTDLLTEKAQKVKLPAHIKYDGTGDPVGHLQSYEGHMYLGEYTDATWCKYFPTTLTGLAQSWFQSLPPGSIYGFTQLAELFTDHFISGRRREKSSMELMKLKQKQGESIRDYLARFNAEAVSVSPVKPDVVMLALQHGLQPSSFRDHLVREMVGSLPEAMRISDKYIRTEEFNKTIQSSSQPEEKAQGEKKEEKPKKGRNTTDNGVANFKSYTPLTTNVAQIYFAHKGDSTWQKPPKLPRAGRDMKSYCDFHECPGHSTEKCQSLKNNIEDLIRRGYFKQYKDWTKIKEAESKEAEAKKCESQPEPSQKKEGGRPHISEIAVIFGDQPSISSLKAQIRSLGQSQNYQVREECYSALATLPTISFGPSDCAGVEYPHNDPLICSVQIAHHLVHRVLIDGGSSINVLYANCFHNMGFTNDSLIPSPGPITGFAGHSIIPKGEMVLPVKLGYDEYTERIAMIKFHVVDAPSPYNIILGRTFMDKFEGVASTFHMCFKYVTGTGGVATLKGNQEAARSCNMTHVKLSRSEETIRARRAAHELSMKQRREQANKVHIVGGNKPIVKKIHPGDQVEPETTAKTSPQPDPEARPEVEPAEESAIQSGQATEEVELYPGSGKKVTIGTEMEVEERCNLISLLRENSDVFAYEAQDMPGIDPSLISHQLNVLPHAKPVQQRRRNFSADKNKAVEEEVQKLLNAGFIEPCQYPEWLANVVMVKKSSGTWRMCVDFTDLNRACPKDFYPLPRIDQLVDSTSGHAMLSFMDAYSGYHQIHMHPADKEKTAFITSCGVFNYVMMPFGLKNAGATYQRMVDKVFEDQRGRNLEVYVDDSIVKSVRAEDHVKDLEETFSNLRKHNVKLNPKKCVFGVRSGKFLGFLVSERGIDANPDKVKAALDLPEPRSVKDVQRLTGRMAALSRFIARSSEKTQPFFKVLRGNKEFAWGEEQKAAFKLLREHLMALPTLARPSPGEVLCLYIAVSEAAVSAVLLREDGRVQQPIHFVSHALASAETRYPLIEKAAYAVIIATRKLRPYFDAHEVVVLSDMPLEKALEKLDKSGRLTKWALELTAFGIKFQPRHAIKAQALADFLAECTYNEEPSDSPGPWQLYTDGSSTQAGAGAGVILISPEGDIIEYALKFQFKATNNEAEYEAVIAGLQLCLSMKATNVELCTDSQLVANQYRGEYEARGPSLVEYLNVMKGLTSKLQGFTIQQIPREENAQADALARLGSSSLQDLTRSVFVEVLPKKTTECTSEHVYQISPRSPWIEEIVNFKTTGQLPTDKASSRKIKMAAARYSLIDGELYRRSHTDQPLLKCVDQDEGNYVLREIHEGICGHHMGARSLAHKALRAGYYWPTVLKDAKDLVRKCDKCQKFAPTISQPANDLLPIHNPIPFTQWGMDLLGPFSTAQGGKKWLIVAIDYFSKWIEAEGLATITGNNVRQFIWKNLLARYGLPRCMVFDHGKQFDNDFLRAYLAQFHIKCAYSAVCHPQSNGQAEAANKQILNSLKKRLDEKKGRWLQELPSTLWSLRTTQKESTGRSPFNLVYGTEALMPVEVGSTSLRVHLYEQKRNDQALAECLDLLEEVREEASVRLATYQNRVSKYYNRKVRNRPINEGDLVLRKSAAVQKDRLHGKLSATWEGPYQVFEQMSPSTFKLMDLDGTPLPSIWNLDQLKKYHV